METTTLYRPVGPEELRLIEESGWRAFPPRLPEQPIFYPVLSEGYAAQIAERWNVPESGGGFVTEFEMDAEYISRFESKQVGGREHQELVSAPRTAFLESIFVLPPALRAGSEGSINRVLAASGRA